MKAEQQNLEVKKEKMKKQKYDMENR